MIDAQPIVSTDDTNVIVGRAHKGELLMMLVVVVRAVLLWTMLLLRRGEGCVEFITYRLLGIVVMVWRVSLGESRLG